MKQQRHIKSERSGRARLVLSYLLMFAAGVVALLVAQRLLRSPSPENRQPQTEGSSSAKAKAGPWGELEITPLVLERPSEVFQRLKSSGPEIRWFFPGFSQAQIAELIGSCDLTAEQKESLLNPKRSEGVTNGWRVLPPVEVMRDMSPVARERIYSVLAQSPENLDQHFPFFFRADGFEEWVGNSDLSPESMSLVRQLCYTKNGRIYFADTQLFELLSSSNETERLVATLSRVPTLLMKVKVTPQSDLDALMKYWGRLRKDDELEYLLRSIARVPGGAAISVSYFMPPVPRVRLYTYPDSDSQLREDCFWTAFNFFNDEAEAHLPGAEHYNALLRAEYEGVHGQKMFGDLLLLLESGETAAHMCVYIADDIVYTKNGIDPYQPWVLMRIKDMMALYASDKPQEWRVFRKRDV